MKKLVLVLALVAVYGFAISNVSTKIITVEKSKVTIISDNEHNSSVNLKEGDKKAEAKKAAVTSVKKAPAKSCCGSSEAKSACSEAAKKCCTASKKACETAEKAPAKKACCGSK